MNERKRWLPSLAASATILVATTSVASSADKSAYSLGSPTPDRLLRELSTDRPDTTESPFTVDAGRFQIESNLFAYVRSRPDSEGAVTDSYRFATTNIRIGVTSAAEINVVLRPHEVVHTRPLAPAEAFRNAGVGGLDIRAKFNVWGNDSFDKPGATALALLPFVTLPTDRSNGVSPEHALGGLIVPYAIKLTDKFGLGLNAGVVYLKDSAAAGYHAEYLSSASLSYEWSEKFGTYYEVAGLFGREDPLGDIVILGTGFTYKLSKNMQFDAGVNVGVTRAADRVNPFLGISTRF